jgi:hypothetical protein
MDPHDPRTPTTLSAELQIFIHSVNPNFFFFRRSRCVQTESSPSGTRMYLNVEGGDAASVGFSLCGAVRTVGGRLLFDLQEFNLQIYDVQRNELVPPTLIRCRSEGVKGGLGGPVWYP